MKRAHIIIGLLFCGLLAAGCGVTEPQEDVWQDIRTFSWPTDTGTVMNYEYSKAGNIIRVDSVTVQIADRDDVYKGEQMFILNNELDDKNQLIRFLPKEDSLIGRNDKAIYGGEGVLLQSPLTKGSEWTVYTIGQEYVRAEILELYSWRKIEGQLYENVVAVRYRKLYSETSEPSTDEEYIRFYAKGIGEVMTILIQYPSTNTTAQPLASQERRWILLEVLPAGRAD